MPDITQAHKALVARILLGDGNASHAQRATAFNRVTSAGPLSALIDKVAMDASATTDDDIGDAKESGLSEDQIFEIVVCAAIGQATRQYEAGLAALSSATA